MTSITKETFKEADDNTKMDILFDYQKNTSCDIKDIIELLRKHPGNCEDRFKKLENKKFKDTIVAGGMGLIAGFSTVLAKIKFWE
jgi:predicted transcriptional regulator